MRVALTWIAFVLLSSVACADVYTFDGKTSEVNFTVRHMLGTVRGAFHDVHGTITAAGEDPERLTVNATIRVRSIDTRIVKRDEHLLSADFFDAARFPEITFRSRAVKRTARDAGDVTGDLTMKGVTRPIVLHVKLLTPAGDPLPAKIKCAITGEPIHRADFNLLFSKGVEAISGIGGDVSATVTLEATRQ